MKVTVVGTGYVGLTQGACLARLGHQVFCVDINLKKVEALKRGEIPIFEKGLPEIVKEGRENSRLKFTTSLKEATAEKPAVVFVCVQTPKNEDGSSDLSVVKKVLEDLGELINASTLVVIKSTVPPGTRALFHEWLGDKDIQLASNPEFLRQGTSVNDFFNPDRIVIGVESKTAGRVLRKLLSGINAPIFETDVETAQMVKYTANNMLALRLSFINEIANIADIFGADIKMIEKVVGMDPRIGSKFLRSSAGFGGSCFPKDVLALHVAAADAGYNSKLIAPIIKVNDEQPLRFVEKIRNHFEDLNGKKFAVWGLSFNKGTDDIRESPAIKIVHLLTALGAKVSAFDPEAMENAKAELDENVEYTTSKEGTLENADALLVLTEWPEFLDADWDLVKSSLKEKVIFDGKNFLPHDDLFKRGFEVFGMGVWRSDKKRLQ